MGLVKDLLILTKYRINAVAVFTGFTALAIYKDLHPESDATAWYTIVMCGLGLLFTAGASNALNQCVEYKRDASMKRTATRRPLPAGRMSVQFAVTIAILQEIAALAIFYFYFNSPLAAGLSLLTLVYYVFFYTMYLKPRHHLNIVIGGVPGAMGPLMAWAAVAQDIQWEPFVLFVIIFLWTPPHFWALAIKLKDDYAAAGIPMLPVVKGVDETTKQIFIYTVILVGATLLVPFWLPKTFPLVGFYTGAAVIGGAVFLVWAWKLWRQRPMMNSAYLFRYSIVYVSLLFAAVIIDVLWLGELL